MRKLKTQNVTTLKNFKCDKTQKLKEKKKEKNINMTNSTTKNVTKLKVKCD